MGRSRLVNNQYLDLSFSTGLLDFYFSLNGAEKIQVSIVKSNMFMNVKSANHIRGMLTHCDAFIEKMLQIHVILKDKCKGFPTRVADSIVKLSSKGG